MDDIIRILNVNPKTNIGTALQAFFENANSMMDRLSSAITDKRNLYPPSVRKNLGAIRSAKTDAMEPKAYTVPTDLSLIKVTIKLELM